jgi:hypothetical protein
MVFTLIYEFWPNDILAVFSMLLFVPGVILGNKHIRSLEMPRARKNLLSILYILITSVVLYWVDFIFMLAFGLLLGGGLP